MAIPDSDIEKLIDDGCARNVSDELDQNEGERYLRLLGLEEHADTPIPTADGEIQARDFLDVCGEHALPVLKGLEAMSPNDSRYDTARNMLRTMILGYIEGEDKE